MKNINIVLSSIIAAFLFLGVMTTHALTISPVRLEVAADPGGVYSGDYKLINESKDEQTFYPSFANFQAKGETGLPEFVENGKGLASWINSPQAITLSPGEEKVIPFSITVPDNTRPGGYFAAIFWSTTPPPDELDGSNVQVSFKVGILVLLKVNGQITEDAGIGDFASYNEAINDDREIKKLYTHTPVYFSYRFQNRGTDRVKPEGDIVIENMFGKTVDSFNANPTEGNILPESTRRFDLVWNDDSEVNGFKETLNRQLEDFRFGRYTANLSLVYGSDGTATNESITFYVFPWQLLLIVFGVIIVLLIIIRFFIRRYNAWLIKKVEKMQQDLRADEDVRGSRPVRKAPAKVRKKVTKKLRIEDSDKKPIKKTFKKSPPKRTTKKTIKK